MKSDILKDRYEFTPDNVAIIDITVESINDLFNSFDKKAAFSRRELDQDFVEYLIDCVREIGDHPFLIRVSIDNEFNIVQENNLRKAIKNYFSYLQEIERITFRKEIRKFGFLMILGISLLALVSKYKVPDSAEIELWQKMLQEGLIIASWVAIWEALTAIFFCWHPFFTNFYVYKRISEAEIKVVYTNTRMVS
ncbi:MAG: hypothetical protein Kow0029_11420 [Candidatus Rifleibacteriota bacterium]